MLPGKQSVRPFSVCTWHQGLSLTCGGRRGFGPKEGHDRAVSPSPALRPVMACAGHWVDSHYHSQAEDRGAR